MCRLKKGSYGLKQAPRAWKKRIDGFLDKIGFVRFMSEHGLYVKICENSNRVENIIIFLYVDDLLIMGSCESLMADCKCELMQEFETSDLGSLSYFLGIEFKKTLHGMAMHNQVCKRFVEKVWYATEYSANTPEVGFKLEKSPHEENINFTQYPNIMESFEVLL